MEDLMIKGTGNSRFLKSVANIMTLYPTYEAFAEALRDGTFPIDLNGINPAGVETMGTRLNKANLLTDATATGMGLTAAATPTQALEKLRQLIQTAQSGVDSRVQMMFGTYTGNGASSQVITLAVTPKLVLLMSNYGAAFRTSGSSNFTYGGIFTQDNPLLNYQSDAKSAVLSGNKLTVYLQTGNRYGNPYANDDGTLYYYAAFY